MDALAVAQREMERIMLGITLRDQRHNTWIRQQTGVTDIIDHIRQSKHRWAGHVARLQNNRWTIRATSWVPRRWLRPRGRLKTRWRDYLSRHLGTNLDKIGPRQTSVGPWKGWSSVHCPFFKKANVQCPFFRKMNVHFSHNANVPVRFSEMECPFLCTSNLSWANHIVLVPKT